MEKEIKGLITSIQDYTVHDGPGLRSLVFLKGCALRCEWCQNPESLNGYPEITFFEKLCAGCMKCKEVCPEEAILKEKEKRINKSKCTRCMQCVEVCPKLALKKVGTWMTSEEIMKILLKYKPFYDSSDKGGITLSGGDPLFQPEFSAELLKECREKGLHTAIETSGYIDYNIFRKITEHLDLLLYDIKHMDDEAHKRGTGVSNKIILENLRKTREEREDLECVIRIPLIPDYNDDTENVKNTAMFLKSIGINQLDLLPFNVFPSGKYREIGKGEWKFKDAKRQSDSKLSKLEQIVKDCGLKTTIGGLW